MRGKEQESCFSVVVTAVEFAESLIKDSFPKAHAGSSSLLEAAAGVPDRLLGSWKSNNGCLQQNVQEASSCSVPEAGCLSWSLLHAGILKK